MIGVALKGLLGRKLRAALTAFAIVLGVAMISGAFVLTDTLGKSFDGIYTRLVQGNRRRHQLEGRDQDRRRDPRRRRSPTDVLRKVERAARRVDVAQGVDRGPVAARRQERARRSAAPAQASRVGIDASADQSLNPLQLVDGPVAARRRADRDRQGHRRRSSTSPSARPSAPSATARSRQYRVTGIVRFGTGDSLGGTTITRLRPRRPRSGCSTSSGKLDAIRVGAETGVVGRRAASGRSRRSCRDDAGEDGRRAGRRGQQGHAGRARASSSTSCSASAASRCSSALRDRQHARDHGRAADARARDAADARRVAAAGAAARSCSSRWSSASSARSSGSSSGSGSRWA